MSATVLDLFAGAVGGWSLGLHRAGYRTVAACEIDPWRRSIFSHNFPDARMYDDVRSLSADRLRGDLGRVPDIIVGSPPCQDISAANTKGKGIDGDRSGLFFEAFRLVGECRPRWCAFENSPYLRTRGYDRLADALEKIGYACWPPVVGADDLGAPHRRKRVWIIAFNAAGLGDGRGRAWGCGADGLAPASVAHAQRHPADAAGEPGRAAREPAGEGGRWREPGLRAETGGPRADTIGDGIRLEPGRGGWENGAGASVAADPADADKHGEHGIPRNGEVAGQLVQPGDADRPRSSLEESLGDDARAQLAALERTVGPAVHSWNGGAARSLGMAHGVAARLALIRVPDHKHPGATTNAAKACISAQGDAIVPDIAEAIGRAILRTDAALASVTGNPT